MLLAHLLRIEVQQTRGKSQEAICHESMESMLWSCVPLVRKPRRIICCPCTSKHVRTFRQSMCCELLEDMQLILQVTCSVTESVSEHRSAVQVLLKKCCACHHLQLDPRQREGMHMASPLTPVTSQTLIDPNPPSANSESHKACEVLTNVWAAKKWGQWSTFVSRLGTK